MRAWFFSLLVTTASANTSVPLSVTLTTSDIPRVTSVVVV